MVALAALVLLAALGAWLIYLTTSPGIGLRDDSYSYFTAAEGLLAGRGYGRVTPEGDFLPLTNFPPLYSVLLAFTGSIGLELEAGARLIAGASFSAQVLLGGILVLGATGSWPLGLAASALILVAPSLLEVNTWAHSEGPYLALTLTSVLLTYAYISLDRKRWVLISAGLVTALAFLTRYAGAALIMANVAAILILAEGSKARRLREGLVFTGVSLLPLIGFLVRNAAVAPNVVNRPRPTWHPPSMAKIAEGADTISAWFVSPMWIEQLGSGATIALSALLVAVLAMTGLWMLHRARTSAPRPAVLGGLIGLHFLTYLGFLAVSLLLFDRLIPLDSRLLSPALLSGLLLLVLGLSTLTLRGASLAKWGAWTALVAAFGLEAVMGIGQVDRLRSEGLGINSPIWRSARALEFVGSLPKGALIYTNNLPALYFVNDRDGLAVPVQYNPAGDRPRQDYEAQLARMHARLRDERGYLLLLGFPPRNRFEPDHFRDLTRGLELVAEFRDGLVYTVPD